MKIFDFSLIFEPFTPDDEAVADALYARIDDALFGVSSGVPYLSFDRQAASLGDAIISAMHDVQCTGLDLRVSRVEVGDSAGSGDVTGTNREHQTISAVNAALELARWHGKPEVAIQFLRPIAS